MSVDLAQTRKRKYANAQERFVAALKFTEFPKMPDPESTTYTLMASQVWKSVGIARMLHRRLAVEEHMKRFQEHARNRWWPCEDAYIADLLREWYCALERHCTLYERAQDERNCTEMCGGADSSIVQLCAKVRAYGCTEHSSVHICDRRTCSAKITTHSHNVVCLFSGDVVGIALGGYDSLNREFERSGSHGGLARRVDSARQAAVGTLEQRTGEASEIVRRIKEEARSAAAQTGSTSTRYIRPNQRLASSRQQFKLQQRLGVVQLEAEKRLVATAERVIDELLFDTEARELINSMMLHEARDASVRALRSYHSACRVSGLVPNAIREAEVYATPFSLLCFLPFVERDEKRRTEFVRLAVSLWRLCHESPYAARVRLCGERGRKQEQTKHWMRQTTCTFVQFCTALLYVQREGLYRENSGDAFERMMRPSLVFVPRDRKFAVELPPENDIDSFGRESLALIRARMHENAMGVESTAAAAFASRSRAPRSRGRQAARTTDIADSLFKADGTRNKRKKRRRKRDTMVGSGRSSIAIRSSALDAPEMVRARERDALPSHLHSDILGEESSYEKPDITRGSNFLQLCINSLDQDTAERESRALFSN